MYQKDIKSLKLLLANYLCIFNSFHCCMVCNLCTIEDKISTFFFKTIAKILYHMYTNQGEYIFTKVTYVHSSDSWGLIMIIHIDFTVIKFFVKPLLLKILLVQQSTCDIYEANSSSISFITVF